MSTPLFRDQALRQASVDGRGTVLLARPLSFALLTAMFASICVAIVVFLASFSFTRKAQVSGVVLPAGGLVRVTAPRAGTVTRSEVRDGERVARGQILFGMADERIGHAGVDVDQKISGLLSAQRSNLEADQQKQEQQVRQRQAAAQARTDALAADLQRLERQQALQARRVTLAREAMQRTQDLRANGFVSANALQDREADLIDQEQRAAEIERSAGATRRQMTAAQDESRDLAAQGQRDAQNGVRAIAALDQQLAESEARRQWLVRADRDGVVSGVTAEPGQRLTENQSMATLVPADSTRLVELYLPSRSIGFVKPGMAVQLRYQAYAYQKFGQQLGRVTEVSDSPLRPEELTFAPEGGAENEPVYRVRVGLDGASMLAHGQKLPLRAGMRVDASILLDRRRLFEWILEPLFGILSKS